MNSSGCASNRELLDRIREAGCSVREIGRTVGDQPLVCVETGGDRLPGIFITAGSHAPEHAGVVAILRLIRELRTDRKVYFVPTRDPVGLNGFAYALGLGLGRRVEIRSYEEVREALEEGGELLYEEETLYVAVAGDFGYAVLDLPRPPWSWPGTLYRLQELVNSVPGLLDRLRGRRVYIPAGLPWSEGCRDFERAVTLVVHPGGEVLHLNRFFERPEVIEEVRYVREVLDHVETGLHLDLHESSAGERFWLPSWKPENLPEELAVRIAKAMTGAVKAHGFTPATLEDLISPDEKDAWKRRQWGYFTDGGDGDLWVNADIRGEGLNFSDYARRYGFAFGSETAMRNPLAQRVDQMVWMVQAAVEELDRIADCGLRNERR